MILENWIKKQGINKVTAAQRLGMWPSNLYAILRGDRRASAKQSEKIEEMTKGEVSRDEAVWPERYIDKQPDGSEQLIMPLAKSRKNSLFAEGEGGVNLLGIKSHD